jgi:phosphatidylcholine synthase
VRSKFKFKSNQIDLSIHGLTVTGVLAGMAALVAVLDKSPTAAVVWMMIAVLIDGIDGPIARRWMSNSELPRFDGYILDLVIDYVTCVVVPAAFMWQFEIVSHDLTGQLAVAAILGSSALWFSQTTIANAQHWFRGFPAAWNLVIPTIWLLGLDTNLNIAISFLLAMLTLSNVEFPHTLQVLEFRKLNVFATSFWMLLIIVFSFRTRELSTLEHSMLLVGPICISAIVIKHKFEKLDLVITD